MTPSIGVTKASLPRPDQAEAFCPHCGCSAIPRKDGAWSKVKAVLWDAEHPLSLDEVAEAAGLTRNAAAVALSHHKRELIRTGRARLYLYRLRWRA